MATIQLHAVLGYSVDSCALRLIPRRLNPSLWKPKQNKPQILPHYRFCKLMSRFDIFVSHFAGMLASVRNDSHKHIILSEVKQ